MGDNYKQQGVIQHKCPNCGAYLKYDPTSGNLRCEHCESVVSFDKDANVVERDFDELVTFNYWKETDIASYRCSNCGAVVVAPRTALATLCPYCSSPVVIEDKTGSVVKPNTLIPFELSADTAAEKLTAWRRRKLYAPNKFRKNAKAESVKGVYLPVWTFDANTVSQYDGSVGYTRTRTVRRNGKTYTETYTEWRHVSGVWNASFDDLFVRANDNIPENYFKQLQPFSQSKYVVFDDEYMAGYLADHYTLEPLEAFERAKETMQANIRRQIVDSYNADSEGPMDVDMDVLSKSFKYLLLPVYIASTRYNNKLYNQYVSGVYSDEEKKQTKVCGKAPVSPWKVLITVLVVLALIAGMIALIVTSDPDPDFFEGWEWDSGYCNPDEQICGRPCWQTTAINLSNCS